jgi:nucleotide-binding universal stress UspA family protein
MFHRIVVAYNESPEAHRALAAGILLAKSLDAELQTITAVVDWPSYTAFAGAADPAIPRLLEDDRQKFYTELQNKAHAQVEGHGIRFQSHLIDGQPVEAIVDFLRRQRADLLVIGLHQREFYVARLWSTVYELAQDAPCSVLGVH